MAIEFSKAAEALSQAAKLGGSLGMEARQSAPSGQFAELVKQVAESAIETSETGERQALAAVRGKAELTEVVTAIANAEVTLQTVVAVRDRIISAYQEIMRMPI
jgi:flagellar hook-basal body complex protein FliE